MLLNSQLIGSMMPSDPATWDQFIINNLAERSPEFASNISTMEIKEADYESGNITGIIIVAGGKVVVPVVVRNFRLKPIDVFIANGKIKSISKRTSTMSLFVTDPYQGLVDRRNITTNNSIEGIMNPPDSALGQQAIQGYTGYNKTASKKLRFSDLLKIASRDTKIKFASIITDDPSLVEILESILPFNQFIAELGVVDKEASEKTQPALFIKKSGNHYTVNGEKKSAGDISEVVSDIDKAVLMTEGEVLVIQNDNPQADVTVVGGGDIKAFNSPAIVHAISKEGDVIPGAFLSSTITFDGDSLLAGLFVGDDLSWICQDVIVGNYISGDPLNEGVGEFFDTRSHNVPSMGDYGVFINGVTAIEPFKVVSSYATSGGYVLSVSTVVSGQRLIIEYHKDDGMVHPSIKVVSGGTISKYFPTDRVYVINGYKYIALKNKVNGAKDARNASFSVSSKSASCGSDLLSIVRMADGQYRVKGAVVNGDTSYNKVVPTKLACQYALIQNGLSAKQAEVFVGMEPVTLAIKQAVINLKTRADGASMEELPQSSPQQPMDNSLTGIVNSQSLKPVVDTEDPDLLNNVLTIGMSKVDDNIREYVISNIDIVSDSIDRLGKLLLMIRTSDDINISEEILGDIVRKLDRVYWELSDYQSINNNQQRVSGT